MPRQHKLTPEQEFDVYKRAQAGEKYELIGAAYGLHKSSVTRLVQRLEQRAVAAGNQPTAKDPKTGVEVEVTDELLLGQVIRDLSQIYQRSAGDVETKVTIAHVLPKLATARHRIRQLQPGPKPAAPPPGTSHEKPADEELVRFNN